MANRSRTKPSRAPKAAKSLSTTTASREVTLEALLEELRQSGAAGKVDVAPEDAPVVAEAEKRLARRIRAHVERAEVDVRLTDNRYTMISVRRLPRQRRYQVRLHHMFVEASPAITRALANYIVHNDRVASRVLGDFIDHHQLNVRAKARRRPDQLLITDGEVHDLRSIYDDMNRLYFDNKVDAAITWGARSNTVRRRTSIKMGSYAVEDRLIRIHRALDREAIPRFFVEWVVFHEMLHQIHGVAVRNGRREFHSKAFLADEAKFAQYRLAKQFERANLELLLTY